MYDVETIGEFDAWVADIKDSKVRLVITKRIDVVSFGSLGETRSLGNGIFKTKSISASVTSCILSITGGGSSYCSAVATRPLRSGILKEPKNWRRSCKC
jgi:hypothetical protein